MSKELDYKLMTDSDVAKALETWEGEYDYPSGLLKASAERIRTLIERVDSLRSSLEEDDFCRGCNS